MSFLNFDFLINEDETIKKTLYRLNTNPSKCLIVIKKNKTILS